MKAKILFILLMSGGAAVAQFNDTLQEVVVTANREPVKRAEAPIAITSISSRIIRDTRPTSIDQLLNKVSGVNMVNLGNEQHQMSIRQPMSTKSLFLYLQDGIPLRTTGLFNHNALIEINMAAIEKIEVIKGPSSSLYGSEAIGGVVNFITKAPPDSADLRISLQGNNIGYKRVDLNSGLSSGRLGISVSGYYADKAVSSPEYTNFHKAGISLRADYRFSEHTLLSNNLSWIDYYSDMPGGIDSVMFASRKFTNPQTFTYRKLRALRYHSSLDHHWNSNSKTSASIIFRDNTIGQNPAYRIRNDRNVKNLAHGEINESSFNSYAFVAQHRQQLQRWRTVVIAGISNDCSPTSYRSDYIRISRDTLSGKYVSYSGSDSVLSNYTTSINNFGAYGNLEFSPVKKMRVVASLRYDLFRYHFHDAAKDTINDFSRASLKLGATYNFSAGRGIYANYSEGFIPPQVTEMYNGGRVPDLVPSVTRSCEVGGWYALRGNKLMVDLSAYEARSTNEVISVRLDDGTFSNRNAGETLHRGIEGGLQLRPMRHLSFRLGGAYSKHSFVTYEEKGAQFDGKEMAAAPRWTGNAELMYSNNSIRAGIEWRYVGRYFTDPANTNRYPGYSTFNFRAGYDYRWFEFWINVLNATDRYYATLAARSAFGYSYNVAEPLNVNIGCTYNIGKLLKINKNEK